MGTIIWRTVINICSTKGREELTVSHQPSGQTKGCNPTHSHAQPLRRRQTPALSKATAGQVGRRSLDFSFKSPTVPVHLIPGKKVQTDSWIPTALVTQDIPVCLVFVLKAESRGKGEKTAPYPVTALQTGLHSFTRQVYHAHRALSPQVAIKNSGRWQWLSFTATGTGGGDMSPQEPG